jgi:hypothetical protein
MQYKLGLSAAGREGLVTFLDVHLALLDGMFMMKLMTMPSVDVHPLLFTISRTLRQPQGIARMDITSHTIGSAKEWKAERVEGV